MSYTTEMFQPGIRLREWIEVGKKAAEERRMQRGIYVRTQHELESMSDYDLNDLGISRLSIKDIAHEAAYGKQR